MLGPPVALALNVPFFMLRKKGKMPNVVCGEAYSKVQYIKIFFNRDVGVKNWGFVCALYTTINKSSHNHPQYHNTNHPTKPQEYEGDETHGGDTLCISKTAIAPGDRVLLVDDLIATGGTLLAGVELVKGRQVGWLLLVGRVGGGIW